MIRHGEAVCNKEGIFGGEFGCHGLTDLGRKQSFALLHRLLMTRELMTASALYSSTLPRAIETADILTPGLASLRVRRDGQLCELQPGEADGMSWEQVIATYGEPDWDTDPGRVVAPGGESWLGFYERCKGALERIIDEHRGELVVIVAHGGVIEQAMKLLFRLAPETRMRLRTENCSMTEIEFSERGQRLLRYNDRAPLAAE
jgi:probable phosphoglycerate mutase